MMNGCVDALLPQNENKCMSERDQDGGPEKKNVSDAKWDRGKRRKTRSWGRMDEGGEKEDRGKLSREGGPAAGCRNVSHACPLDDLASLECGRYWE